MSSVRPHFQQAVYDEGHTAGRRAGFTSGEIYGRAMQKLEDSGRFPLGVLLGVVIGAVLQPLVFWIKGICW